MPGLRRDPITGRWMIIAREERKGPKDFPHERAIAGAGDVCPFCSGNEEMTPPEISCLREERSRPNAPGWQVRVIPNKFPALHIGAASGSSGLGVYDWMDGLGAHEVIIETPEHRRDIAEMAPEEVERILRAYIERSLDLRKDSRFHYILIFKNHGRAAGASLEHPHSQLIALPIVPLRLSEELSGIGEYFNYKERCAFCDIIRQETEDKERIVLENDDFLSFAPFASRFPFETWVIPRAHHHDFGTLAESQIGNLARILRDLIRSMSRVLDRPAYNYLIHTSPLGPQEKKEYHWHIELIPKLMPTAGFEWGTGFFINPVVPEEAAEWLREGIE